MKRLIKKYERYAIMAGIAALFLSGCGAGENRMAVTETPAANNYASEDIYAQEFATESEEAATGNSASVATGRKLIKNVNMDVETEGFDELVATVEQKVDALGGYIENINVYNGSSRYGSTNKNANMTIRIPKDKLDEFVTKVAEVSNVVSRDESTQDVTMQYVDLESHKKALVTEQERLLELLGQAESVEDIIAIEERLSQVRYELESMESQLRTYDNLVDFSTVYLNITEVERLTPVEEVSAMERMAAGFVNSLKSLMKGIKNFLIALVIGLPYLIFWAVIILLILWIIRRIKKKKAMEIAGLQFVKHEQNGKAMQPHDGEEQDKTEHKDKNIE